MGSLITLLKQREKMVSKIFVYVTDFWNVSSVPFWGADLPGGRGECAFKILARDFEH